MKANDCLQTPEWVWRALGPIDLDPCAGPDTCIAKTNWAIERGEDGLTRDWFGFVYCNPPFSQKEQWIEKMRAHRKGILILPERGSAPWFGPLAMSAGNYFVMGQKINFVGGPSSNNLGSALFLFGDEAYRRVRDSRLPGHFAAASYYRERSSVSAGSKP